MTIFETIGMAWVIFTSSLATVAIIYMSIVGLKVIVKKDQRDQKEKDNVDIPVEVKEMFKIAR